MVTVITSDGRIWNESEVILEILAEHINSVNKCIEIDLNSEGPCCVDVGIDTLLDSISSKFNIDKERFVINTANQLPSSKYTEQRKINGILGGALSLCGGYSPSVSNLKNTFGIFIGRSNWQRIGLASYIWKKYKDISDITFHYDNNSDFHINNSGIEDLIHHQYNDIDTMFEFLHVLPLAQGNSSYPILWSDNAYDLRDKYHGIFCEIICETYFSGKTFFVTEKTYRCILNKRPFMIQGPKYFLKNLKKLGFKTFNKWWCEGYDLDESDARYDTLKHGIDWIASQSNDTIEQWYLEMQNTLEHNYDVLCNLTNSEILDTEFYYE
jgi:hypothetical protein